MTKRPLSVTVISGLFAAAGIVGLAYHATEFRAEQPFQYELVWVCLVRLLAVVCAIFMFRGHDWARVGLLVWLAYHVVLSGFHSLAELLVHSLLLAVIGYFLLRPEASAYFRSARAVPAETPKGDCHEKAQKHAKTRSGGNKMGGAL